MREFSFDSSGNDKENLVYRAWMEIIEENGVEILCDGSFSVSLIMGFEVQFSILTVFTVLNGGFCRNKEDNSWLTGIIRLISIITALVPWNFITFGFSGV